MEEDYLLQLAEDMFPEGQSCPRSRARTGAPAPLINALYVNAKAAIDTLFKRRGYDDMSADERMAQLGYRLDKEEALAYLVVAALHLPMLSPASDEPRVIGGRIRSSLGDKGALGKKLAEHKKRGTSAEPTLRAPAALNLAPPKKKPKLAVPAPPPPAPPPPAPPPPTPPQPPQPPPQPPPHPAPPPPRALPPVLPSRKQIVTVFGSREAAQAIYACREIEFAQAEIQRGMEKLANPPPDPLAGVPGVQPLLEAISEQIKSDRATLAESQKEHASALLALSLAFPAAKCCDAWETGACVHGIPCECGWRQAPWPWIVHRPGGCFCDCHMEERAAWMRPARLRYWGFYTNDGPEVGRHLYPNFGPQRGNGSNGAF